MIGVILLNGSIFGVYSYLSPYLGEVTDLPAPMISGLLFVYGLMNIVGNTVAGRALSKRANRFIIIFPVMMGAVYALMLLFGGYAIGAAVLILLWGILAGAGGNINQYWISWTAPEAPEFANGLFLTASNLGITIAAFLCGLFIKSGGIDTIFMGGLLLLAGSTVLIFIKIRVIERSYAKKSIILLEEARE